MAEQNDDIESTEEENDTGSGKSKMLIIIIAVLVLALAGAGAMLFLSSDDETGEDVDADETAEADPVVKQTPIYYSVEKPLVVNFSDQSQGAVRYLQVKLKVMARDQDVIDAFKLHLPAIQHDLLLLFYSQNYDELNATGTKVLQENTLTNINQLLSIEKLENKLEAVYFTSFLMQ